MIALLVEQLARRGKIKEVYILSVKYGYTRYLDVYIPGKTYIPMFRMVRVYPVVRYIYAGYAR
jgi:hypothetical protein